MRTLLICPALTLLLAPNSATAASDLAEYVKRPEPKFAWKQRNKVASPLGTVYDLELTSQEWHGILWAHQLQVYQAPDVKPNGTLLLFNTGGKAGVTSIGIGLDISRRVGAPVAFLYDIPNQPLLDGKKEDALIAETFVRTLDTKDFTWPLLLPMVKSLVKAMDALQAFAKEEWRQVPHGFVVSGASKRGWTTWLTAAVDTRVKAIAPMVIDTLNMVEQLKHQKESFGKYSAMIGDYTARGLVPLPDSDDARKVWGMVDPYLYRDRLTMPKLIILGNNDPYWTVDALNLYWDGLKGDKYICYTPNAGHDLRRRDKPGDNRDQAIAALAAFVKAQSNGHALPKLDWKHDDVEGQCRLTVTTGPGLQKARLWVADAPTRDFRMARWTAQPVKMNGAKVIGMVDAPTDGYRALYAELECDLAGMCYSLSTQIRVVGKK